MVKASLGEANWISGVAVLGNGCIITQLLVGSKAALASGSVPFCLSRTGALIPCALTALADGCHCMAVDVGRKLQSIGN